MDITGVQGLLTALGVILGVGGLLTMLALMEPVTVEEPRARSRVAADEVGALESEAATG